jgi:hypothetical protein
VNVKPPAASSRLRTTAARFTGVAILGQLSSDFETFSICSALNHNVAKDGLIFISREELRPSVVGLAGNRFGHRACLTGGVRYAIHFTDGSKMDCLTLEGAMRVIACRHRVRRGDLITETTEEKILVWLYPGEICIAEVFVSSGTATTMR